MPRPRRSRENWVKKSSNYTQHQNDKQTVEKLKEDEKLQEKIKNVKVL